MYERFTFLSGISGNELYCEPPHTAEFSVTLNLPYGALILSEEYIVIMLGTLTCP